MKWDFVEWLFRSSTFIFPSHRLRTGFCLNILLLRILSTAFSHLAFGAICALDLNSDATHSLEWAETAKDLVKATEIGIILLYTNIQRQHIVDYIQTIQAKRGFFYYSVQVFFLLRIVLIVYIDFLCCGFLLFSLSLSFSVLRSHRSTRNIHYYILDKG